MHIASTLTPAVSVSRCLVANHPEVHTPTVGSGGWAPGAPCVSAASSWAALLLGVGRSCLRWRRQQGITQQMDLSLFSEPQRACRRCHILWLKASPSTSHGSRGGEQTSRLRETAKSCCKRAWIPGWSELWACFIKFPHVNIPWRGESRSKSHPGSDPPDEGVPMGTEGVSQYDSWGNRDPLLF